MTGRTSKPVGAVPPTPRREVAYPAALLLGLGYSLHFMVITFIGWPGQPSSLFGGTVYDDALGAFTLARNAAFCLGFFAFFALAMALGARGRGRIARTVLGLVPSLLVVAGALPPVLGWGSPGWDALCGVLVGVGFAGNFVLYQYVICLQESPLDAWCLTAGTAGGAVLYFLLSWLPVEAVRVFVLCAATPACGALAVGAARAMLPPAGKGEGAAAPGIPGQPMPAPRRALVNGLLSLAIPTLAIGAIAAVMTAARLHFANSAGVDLIIGSPLNLGLILGAAITLGVYVRTRYRVDTDVYARIAVPVIALASVGLPFFGDGYGAAFTLALYVLFVVASIDLILACSQATRFYGIPPMALYALAFGIVYTLRFVPTLPVAAGVGTVTSAVGDDTCLLALAFVGLLFAVYVAGIGYGRLQRRSSVYAWTTLRTAPRPVPVKARGTQGSYDRFAARHGLTAREAEVAQFFIEGRTVPYVASQLVVSESTVKYHSKNIYRKCGVAGRQDLLDLYAAELDERVVEEGVPHNPSQP